MDYKIVSPSEYFGTSVPMAGNHVFISQNNIGNQLNPVIMPQNQHPHEGGLNILASGAVAATPAPSQGYPYPTNPTDNYGYIVNNYIIFLFIVRFINIVIILKFRDQIIELLIIIQVKDILKLLLQLHQQPQISQMPHPQLQPQFLNKTPRNHLLNSSSNNNNKIIVNMMEGKEIMKEEVVILRI
jgi:hypothetical protein